MLCLRRRPIYALFGQFQTGLQNQGLPLAMSFVGLLQVIALLRQMCQWYVNSVGGLSTASFSPYQPWQTTQQFLELFRNNLLDVNVDPAPYGTHSFRRGGCQYLHCYRRWSFRRVCEWGGWSTDFSYLTIVKYLISVNDDPMECREDFFNPQQLPTVRCPACGRQCNCGF
jgi:hypothetical protein